MKGMLFILKIYSFMFLCIFSQYLPNLIEKYFVHAYKSGFAKVTKTA